VLLEDQDRDQWDPLMIDEAIGSSRRSAAARTPRAFVLQAAIAGLHAQHHRRSDRLADDSWRSTTS